MTDLEKLKELTANIDSMLAKQINPSSEEFTLWRTKVERILERLFGEKSKEYKEFRNRPFWSLIYTSSMDVGAVNRKYCHDALQTTRAKLRVYIEELEENDCIKISSEEEVVRDFTKVFIVHGHDSELKEKVSRLLEKQGIDTIVINEKENLGRTIIEKIEAYTENVGAAICLYTPDDEMVDGSKRARQNVVFETGYFFGKIGRGSTIIVAEDEALNFSDLDGVVYVNKNNWRVDVLKELRAIGYKVDMNKL